MDKKKDKEEEELDSVSSEDNHSSRSRSTSIESSQTQTSTPPSSTEKKRNSKFISITETKFKKKVSDNFYSLLYDLRVNPDDWKTLLHKFRTDFSNINQETLEVSLGVLSDKKDQVSFIGREFSWKRIDQIIKQENEEETGSALRKIFRTNASFQKDMVSEIINQYSVYYGLESEEILNNNKDQQGNNISHIIAYSITDNIRSGNGLKKDDWSSLKYIEEKYPFLLEEKNNVDKTSLEIISEEGVSFDEEIFFMEGEELEC